MFSRETECSIGSLTRWILEVLEISPDYTIKDVHAAFAGSGPVSREPSKDARTSQHMYWSNCLQPQTGAKYIKKYPHIVYIYIYIYLHIFSIYYCINSIFVA